VLAEQWKTKILGLTPTGATFFFHHLIYLFHQTNHNQMRGFVTCCLVCIVTALKDWIQLYIC